MTFPTAAQGARKEEPSSCPMPHGLCPQPARLVRGRSRRIMTLRFRTANIRVINRSVGPCAVIRLLSKTENHRRSKLTGGNPQRPPQKQRPVFLPLVGTPAEIKTLSSPEGLDNVAPYQNE
jgi:hypothetical protein